MKLAMAMTMDALIRVLRAQMHQMADEREAGYARQKQRPERDAQSGTSWTGKGGGDDFGSN